jgi:hypothetical protein
LVESLGVADLEQRRKRTGDTVGESVSISHGHSVLGRPVLGARAARLVAFTEDLVLITGGFLASQLTLGLGAQLRGLALPGTLGLLAQGRTVGLGGGAGGTADSGAADGLTSGAVLHLAHLLRASDGADGLFAVNLALSALSRLAVHLALGASTHGVALGRAHGVVTKPLALWVALGGHSRGGKRQDNEGKDHLHGEKGRNTARHTD